MTITTLLGLLCFIPAGFALMRIMVTLWGRQQQKSLKVKCAHCGAATKAVHSDSPEEAARALVLGSVRLRAAIKMDAKVASWSVGSVREIRRYITSKCSRCGGKAYFCPLIDTTSIVLRDGSVSPRNVNLPSKYAEACPRCGQISWNGERFINNEWLATERKRDDLEMEMNEWAARQPYAHPERQSSAVSS